jgi:ornithine carbamoyltransferase
VATVEIPNCSFFHGRSLLKETDLTAAEFLTLIDLAAELRDQKRAGTERRHLVGRNIALIFEKASTRTRAAFEVGAFDQGAHVTYLGPEGSHIGEGESIKDTARVLGRMYDGIEFRGFAQESVEVSGARIHFGADVLGRVEGADLLYADVWVSMGEPAADWGPRIEKLLPYQVNAATMAMTANPEIKFMHCLPALHDPETELGRRIADRWDLHALEVTDEVFESPASIVFDQAENRLHTIKAAMVARLGD